MDANRIAELRRLCEAATDGPWGIGNTGAEQRMILSRNGEGNYVCNVQIFQTPRHMGMYAEPEREANAYFISAARTALPALLDEVERLRGSIEEIEHEAQQAKHDSGAVARASLFVIDEIVQNALCEVTK